MTIPLFGLVIALLGAGVFSEWLPVSWAFLAGGLIGEAAVIYGSLVAENDGLR